MGSGLLVSGLAALAAFLGAAPRAEGQPLLAVEPAALDIALSPGDSAFVPLHVANLGEPGSQLVWSVAVHDPFLPGGRNIDGSTFTAEPPDYLPGQTRQFALFVTNNSPDYDWLDGITLDFPPGATVLGSTNFVGGSGGPLVTNHATGDGVIVRWLDVNGGWGNVYGGQTVTATVTVAFAAWLAGDLELPWTMSGDGYGAPPHDIEGKLILDGPPGPDVEVLVPDGGEIWALGESRQVLWDCWGGVVAVNVLLSRDGGANWELLGSQLPPYQPFDWVVAGPLSADCRVRVADAYGSGEDTSAASFFIHRPIDWLTILGSGGGVLAAGEVDTLWVRVGTAGLPPGEDQLAGLRFTANDPAGGLIVPLTLRVGLPTAAPATLPAAGPQLTAWPNPFGAATRLVFAAAAAGPLRLEILDLQGRRLRLLAAAEAAGPGVERALVWDGRDEAGRRLPSGVYLVRLTSGGASSTRKLLLMK
ncbi:T9SS type A sorting domain-containing protein [bacterium]|nr:T9SS type A sorting domain-containing protein [bacterium]